MLTPGGSYTKFKPIAWRASVLKQEGIHVLQSGVLLSWILLWFYEDNNLMFDFTYIGDLK